MDSVVDESSLNSEDDDMETILDGDTQSQQQLSCTAVVRRRARKACVGCHNRRARKAAIRSGAARRPLEAPKAPVDMIKPVRTAQNLSSSRIDLNPESSKAYKAWSVLSSGVPKPYPGPRSEDAKENIDVIYSYYNFLSIEPASHIPPDDFKFLERKGCFHLPSRSILNEFVREYYLHIHPCLPIIHEKDFWDMYLDNGRGSKVHSRLSLFVFRAMIFASCSFVSLSAIRALGFQDSREARLCLYRRAKFLYDMATISEPIEIAQGALLLTYYSSEREQHANTTWLRTAIQFASTVNAHLYHKSAGLPQKEYDMKKRLWWCCILRDRILPLGLRRSIQITRDTFDFNQEPLSKEDLEPEFDHSCVYSSETKRYLAEVFTAQLKLAVELTDVMSLVYPSNDFSVLDQLDPETLEKLPDKISYCRKRLDGWNKDKTYFTLEKQDRKYRHESIILYHDLTQIYYQSARAALCHCEAFALQANKTDVEESNVQKLKDVGSELHSAIASISESVSELVNLDLARYLPVSVVAYMALPLVLISVDVNLGSRTSDLKRRQLRLYREAMDVCQKYTGTSVATQFISKTIASARCDLSLSNLPEKTQESTLSRSLTTKIEDWFEAFISRPKLYLRIALTIDMFLSLGRYPATTELPQKLFLPRQGRVLEIGTETPEALLAVSNYSYPGTISEMNVGHELAMAATSEGSRSKNLNLDYFDLNCDRVSTAVANLDDSKATGAWSGETVEDILDEMSMHDFGVFSA
ncbi:hypothetical protein BP6252_05518 [Coleophoma cylindrospora]|uniref:Xylanolytic transcriptional activator regulatory domain-containing protein n=1 Tax=Coleophoma cylindrospora TaxID=1849047 RepID=A0A3D8RTY2_9HELO|nr:hypothetical protein BP6252_05518 [Coleophoma cylindrospora]